METLPPSFHYGDEDSKNLQQLLEAFGSVVSLEDIASAYCDAGRDLCIAGDILCNLQASTSTTLSFESEDAFVSMETPSSASLDNSSKKASSKSKKCSASMGIVPNVIRRENDKPKAPKDEASKMTKPVKLNSDDFPASLIWKGKDISENTEKSETLQNDVEDFLFKMLGDGFLLNMNTIHDVVGQCGYDVNKSMDTLINMSAATLEKCDDIFSIDSEKSVDLKSSSSEDSSSRSSKTDSTASNSHEMPKKEKKSKYELQKEILESLFSDSGRDDADEVEIIRPPNERVYRSVVDKPLQLPEIEHRTVITRPRFTELNDGEDEESYDVLRKAVKEYWITMKENYKAATEAYLKGDRAKAYKLQEEGNFFMKKAREADEKSAQMLLQPRVLKEELIFDVRHFEPKEAISFLKRQLTVFSGIPSIEYVRVVVGTPEEDDVKGRRKRLIVKLLNREAIPWTEEENGKTLAIKVDEIDRKKLSFFKSPSGSM